MEMSEEINAENEIILDSNRLFVYRSSSGLTPPPISRSVSVQSCPEIELTRMTSRMEFGLAWVHLTYAPQEFMSNKSKTILRNISGQIKFGQIVGLMGPSGCGKSTLLRCINGRIGSGLAPETEIYISNRRIIQSCFIVQDQKEHLLMNLTARESLLYASKIKNGFNSDNISDDSINRSFSSTLGALGVGGNYSFDHNINVNKLLTNLTLSDCADTKVLNCSGGQQKRIVIALELVGEEKPNIICIDEPTSGLDSNAAEQVIECLRNVSSDHSIGIITTIHQPNSDILMMFDWLYVLAKGGYCVYNGKPELIREFLVNSNISIKETQVPIEMLMKVASKTTFSSNESEMFKVNEEIKSLANKTEYSVDELKDKCQTFGKLTDLKHINIQSIGFSFIDFWFLMQRTVKCNIIRGWKSILFIMLFEISAGLSNAILFGKTGEEDGCLSINPYLPHNTTCVPIDPVNQIDKEQQTLQNFKFIFFALLLHNFLQLCYTVLTFPQEVKIFFNEQQNRWYSSGSYYWAKNLVDDFIGLTITTAFTLVIYTATAQIGKIYEKRFGLFLLSNILSTLCAQGMSYTFSIIATESLKICLILAIGGNLTNTLFSGFLLPVSDMNAFMQKLALISYTKASFEIQIYSIYGFDRCDPKRDQWSAILYQMDLKDESFQINLILLIAQTILWRIIALICLIVKTNDLKSKLILNKCKNNDSLKKHDLIV